MSVGLAVTKDQVDVICGGIAKELHRQLNRGQDLFQAMQDVTDAQLGTMGYTAQEITDLRAALSDMNDLGKIYKGNIALAAAKDFRLSFKKIYGIPTS